MTVRELLSKADSRELTEWMVYLRMKDEPEVIAPEKQIEMFKAHSPKKAKK